MLRRWGITVLAALVPLAWAGTATAAGPGTATITGTVTDQGGNRLPGICVQVYDVQDPGEYGDANTNSAGEYSIDHLPEGDPLKVSFFDCVDANSKYANQWYDNATSYQTANEIVVPDGGTASGIDATMAPGVNISGTVTDQAGQPVPQVCVTVQAQHQSQIFPRTTDDNGNYTVTGMQPDTYTVKFDQGCGETGKYAVQWYDGASSAQDATQLTASTGETFANIDAQLVPTGAPTPTVTGVSPSSGPTSGGSYVTITGTNFSSTPTVMFGSKQSSSVKSRSDTEVDAVAPAGSDGIVDITVTTPAGTSDVGPADQFTYDASQPALVPSITSISPPSGPTSGGGLITITGENLGGAYAVFFGNGPRYAVRPTSNTEIRIYAPPHDAGTFDITVNTSPLGPTANTPADQYTFDAGVSPTLPEAPLPLLIPIAGVIAGAFVVRRRRRRALIHD